MRSSFRNYGLEERRKRAFQQRIYLIDMKDANIEQCSTTFIIAGTTGNEYKVSVGEDTGVSCECPDFSMRGNFCKHCLFVLLRVLAISSAHLESVLCNNEDHITTLTDVMSGTLIEYLISHRERGSDGNAKPLGPKEILFEKLETKKVAQREITKDDACAICFEEFYSEDNEFTTEPLVFCEFSCGQTLHAQCFNKWASTRGQKVQCVYCRHDWYL